MDKSENNMIKNDNYFTIKGWMINELGLSGSALIAYAVIYGFSQDDKSSFCGSVSYLASCAGVSKRGMINVLHGLLDKGYIIKKDTENGTQCNAYIAVYPSKVPPSGEKTSPGGGEKTSPGGEKTSPGGEKSSPYNIFILHSKGSHTDQADEKISVHEKNKLYFIKLWQANSDTFNPISRLQNFDDFNAWWEKSNVTEKMIEAAVKNVVEGVKNGAIERRYIPGSPDKFVLNGWIHRSQEPYIKKGGPSPPGNPFDDWSNFGEKE
jgi:hypothetical protein